MPLLIIYLSHEFLGYKLRRQISVALQRRSQAIRNALNRYNTQAALLDPPRLGLSWADIVNYSFIGEFDLLRHSHQDIRSAPWAKPAQRAATLVYFKLCRAKEELDRLNIEIRRLRTFIQHENTDLDAIITKLTTTAPLVAQEIKHQHILRSSVNAEHICRLNLIEELPGFTGVKGSVGQREGRVDFEGTEVVADKGKSASKDVLGVEDYDQVDMSLGEEAFDNEVREGISVVVDFMDSIDN